MSARSWILRPRTTVRNAWIVLLIVVAGSAFYFLSDPLIFKHRDPSLKIVEGQIVGCHEIGSSRRGYVVRIFLDVDDPSSVSFREPQGRLREIRQACANRIRVRIEYLTSLRRTEIESDHWARTIHDLTRNRTVVSRLDYEEWEREQALWGWVLAVAAGLSSIYSAAVLLGIVPARK